MKLTYKKQGRILTYVTMFKYDGDNLQSVLHDPSCYVKTIKINDVDVKLAEYILHFVPSDYQLTDEDRAFIATGKGDFSCDGVTEGDSYMRSMYWIQDGVYYELMSGEENYPVEILEKMVKNIMNADPVNL